MSLGNGCSFWKKDKNRFEEPIKKNVIDTFKEKKKVKRKDGKFEEVKVQRDLFGRLLGISLEEKLDIEAVLEYPLTPMPLSFCHLDVSINKTDKSKLIVPILRRDLEQKQIPVELDAVIIDGFFYLYMLKDLPSTFDGLSHNLFVKLQNITIVFDTYPTPSIKNNEHEIRQNLQYANFIIEGPETRRPANFIAELKNIKFKEAFVKFLIKDWMTESKYGSIKPTQKIRLPRI